MKKNEKLKKENAYVNIKESIEKPIEIKSFEEDKNKFKEILTIIDSNKFNYRNKIGEFKYIDIRDLIILEIIQLVKEMLKKNLNTLNNKKCRNKI